MDQSTALLASIAIEAAAAGLLLAILGWGRAWRGAVAAGLATLASHPVVWAVFPETMLQLGYWPAFALIEFLVVLAESIAYRLIVPVGWRRALVLSFAANGASAGLGLAYHYAVAVL